ncbi:hypothetical protein [Aureimonas glaciei]|uniref:Uncharacterized protein n=1 Tax=Aureimonas glaciei TaxID=1776957 RepID=A0A916Y464_9HYPH|nr:hypothetical protein [Aureimonas glaciei]GGD28853.1 hypothetical protein GCM10011335_35010 [Aureimonas glaciei]
MTHIRVTRTPNGRTLIVGFHYDSRAVDAIRGIPGARWYNNAWRVSALHAEAVEAWRAEHEARLVETAARNLAVRQSESEARRLEDEARQVASDAVLDVKIAQTKADRILRTHGFGAVGTRDDIDRYVAEQLKDFPLGGYGTTFEFVDLGDGIIRATGSRYSHCD